MTQYPHHLFMCDASEAELADGMWRNSNLEWKYLGCCRQEPEGRGLRISLAGGEWINVSSTIYAPLQLPDVNLGTLLKVCNDKAGDDIRDQGVCLRYSRGQMNVRIWI